MSTATLHPQEAYQKRVGELEDQGLCTSDAQGVADAEYMSKGICTLCYTRKANCPKNKHFCSVCVGNIPF